MEKIEIEVNGTQIKLTEFPSRIIINTITAMLMSLRDVEIVENAVIRLKRASD